MDINYYKKFEPIDGKWYIVKELGSGAFGTVFEVERRDFSQAKSALKVITIPSSPNEVNSYREDNYDLDEQSISSYFYGFVEEFTDEFKLMTKLRGNSNIVSIEDYDVVEHKDVIGWDIFIRMELLTPMNKYFRDHELSQRDIIKLGIDICKALEVCQKYKIIHRDIKPSNIFVSDTGEFKLGDFGIARTLEKTSSGLSKKGTYTYMAPEVHVGGEYGSNVDIYSLGIVMYKLLNNNFEPFRTQRTHNDEEEALTRRLKGEKIPKPANADGRLAEIVLKACSFNPKERYESPLRMREELENILYSESEAKVIYPNGDEVEYEASTNGSSNEKTVSMFGNFTVTDVEEEHSKTVSIFDSDAIITEEKSIVNQFDKVTDIQENKKAGTVSAEEKRAKINSGLSKNKGKLFKKSILGVLTATILLLGIIIAIAVGTPSHNKETNGVTTVDNPKIISISTGMYHTIGLKEDGTVVATGNNENGECSVQNWTNIVSISAGQCHTVGLKNDGTVVAVGGNEYGQCNVENWTEIKKIYTSEFTTVGLRNDGTVVAVGNNEYGQCNTQNWSDIISVYAEEMQTTGLKSDGTIVVAGENDWGQQNVDSWKDIKEVCGGNGQTVGLKDDGTVVAVGWNDYGQCNTQDWSNITSIYMDNARTLGLRTDGTVVATGANLDDIGNVKNWTEIRKIYTSDFTTIGLRNDGTVIATGLNLYGESNVQSWIDITDLSLGWQHTVGLKNDGTVVATGDNRYDQCDVSDW